MADHDRRKIRKLTHAFADGTATHPTPLGILQRHAEQMSCMPPQYVFWRLENKSKGTGIDWIAAVLIRGRYIWTSDRHKFKIHAKMQAAERALVWHYSSSLEPFADTISSRNAIIAPRYMKRQGVFAVEFDWSVPVLKNVACRKWSEWRNAPTIYKEFFQTQVPHTSSSTSSQTRKKRVAPSKSKSGSGTIAFPPNAASSKANIHSSNPIVPPSESNNLYSTTSIPSSANSQMALYVPRPATPSSQRKRRASAISTGPNLEPGANEPLAIKTLRSNLLPGDKKDTTNEKNTPAVMEQFVSQLMTILKYHGPVELLANVRQLSEQLSRGIAKQVSSMSLRDDIAFGILQAASKGHGDHSIGGDGRVWTIADKFLTHARGDSNELHLQAGKQSSFAHSSMNVRPQASPAVMQNPTPVIKPSAAPKTANLSVSSSNSSSAIVESSAKPTGLKHVKPAAAVSESSGLIREVNPHLLSTPHNQVVKYAPRLSIAQLAQSLTHTPPQQNSHTTAARGSSSSHDSEDTSMSFSSDDRAAASAKAPPVDDTNSQISAASHPSTPTSLTSPLLPNSASTDCMEVTQTIDDMAVPQISNAPTNSPEQTDQDMEKVASPATVDSEASAMEVDEESNMEVDEDAEMEAFDDDSEFSDEAKGHTPGSWAALKGLDKGRAPDDDMEDEIDEQEGSEMDVGTDDESMEDASDDDQSGDEEDSDDDGDNDPDSHGAAISSTTQQSVENDATMSDAQSVDYDSDTLSDPPSDIDEQNPFDDEMGGDGWAEQSDIEGDGEGQDTADVDEEAASGEGEDAGLDEVSESGESAQSQEEENEDSDAEEEEEEEEDEIDEDEDEDEDFGDGESDDEGLDQGEESDQAPESGDRDQSDQTDSHANDDDEISDQLASFSLQQNSASASTTPSAAHPPSTSPETQPPADSDVADTDTTTQSGVGQVSAAPEDDGSDSDDSTVDINLDLERGKKMRDAEIDRLADEQFSGLRVD